ncbi:MULTISPECIES: hypothetical protein [Acetobacter]|jgi:ElaB/YqjD/DUF883 family membrane-anchored ribosome-binding protein|uniref:DUF883 domain-containing protein n=1 Tax=Acetobacter peroxydans TaxID=104098 RepID=A0A4Y3TXJ7_9PROT|nr:hypothetical protein [Acetobacter peroxydans]MCH4142260.1 hypothetical protein [Acetobacter peroxydans]MCI1395482.1 hypothetical protein [Acetobacter peroxydans]MCI1410831.1 hypothetical protein [Acetobacter peroxydans]MCI1566090.1 hypothetical protein [Acetobacter peroxydans]MCI1618428.1 hypothetical protein [Acetobacter peroxydans]
MSSDKIKDIKAAGAVAADAARDEIDALKAQLEKLIGQHVAPVLGKASEQAGVLTEQAVANARELADHARNDLAKQTRGQTSWVSIAFAGVVGFILGRLSR